MSTPHNLKVMKPGPRGPESIPSVDTGAVQAEIQRLRSELARSNAACAALTQTIQQNRAIFERILQERQNYATHLAAILNEKFNGVAFISVESLENVHRMFMSGGMAGFDFDDIGPDAIGPVRHRMRVIPKEEFERRTQEMAKVAQAQVQQASPGEVINTAEAAEPVPCSDQWHRNKNREGETCPSCFLRFPQFDENPEE